MIEFVRKYWERIVLLLVTVIFFVFVGIGIFLQGNGKGDTEPDDETSQEKIEVILPEQTESQSPNSVSSRFTSFYLRPLPGELMEQIANLDSLDEKVATGKFSGLPVMWSVYFFSFQQHEDKSTTVRLDVSEDGFGVMIICDADVKAYPEITEVESGKKMWVAGEILSVDPSGTGTIYLKSDYFRFTELEEVAPVVPADEK